MPAAGAPIRAGDREIGRVTSAVTSPLLDGVIALGYVQRDFVNPGTELHILDGQQPLSAVVAPVPFVAPVG